MDDFSGEKRDDFYKIDDVDEQNSEFQEKSRIILEQQKKIPNQYITISFIGCRYCCCLILGIVLANFITEENSENLSDIPIN